MGEMLQTVLRAMVKSHNRLKGTKAVSFLEEISFFFQNLQGKSTCWGPFIVKLQHVMSYKTLLGQLYQKKAPTRRLLHNYFL